MCIFQRISDCPHMFLLVMNLGCETASVCHSERYLMWISDRLLLMLDEWWEAPILEQGHLLLYNPGSAEHEGLVKPGKRASARVGMLCLSLLHIHCAGPVSSRETCFPQVWDHGLQNPVHHRVEPQWLVHASFLEHQSVMNLGSPPSICSPRK